LLFYLLCDFKGNSQVLTQVGSLTKGFSVNLIGALLAAAAFILALTSSRRSRTIARFIAIGGLVFAIAGFALALYISGKSPGGLKISAGILIAILAVVALFFFALCAGQCLEPEEENMAPEMPDAEQTEANVADELQEKADFLAGKFLVTKMQNDAIARSQQELEAQNAAAAAAAAKNRGCC
jgi:hypothetical protein